ncbi:MAG: YlbF family regulator [Firmicutes bacterium]|nr:YlbF family regulator [Bacillota bacterium]
MLNKNPYDQAHELARALRESELYQRYIVAQKQLALDPEAQERVRKFRVQQMEVNQAQLLGQAVPDGKVSQVALEYAKLNRDKNIAEFLDAEGTFMQLFADIQQIIQKSLESGLTE